MSDSSTKKDAAQARQAPVITPEIAEELAREGEELRREFHRKVEAMWTISRDARQTRSR